MDRIQEEGPLYVTPLAWAYLPQVKKDTGENDTFNTLTKIFADIFLKDYRKGMN